MSLFSVDTVNMPPAYGLIQFLSETQDYLWQFAIYPTSVNITWKNARAELPCALHVDEQRESTLIDCIERLECAARDVPIIIYYYSD